MNVVVLGANSDIAKELTARFVVAGDSVYGWQRGDRLTPDVRWDLVINCIGVLDPIGPFFDTDESDWERNVDSNAMLPLRLLRRIWKNRNVGASVCFFSGAGVSNQAKTYSGYSASKIMLMKMVELLDDEEGDVKFFILGPGMVRTKIQRQTILAGPRADNFERVTTFMDRGDKCHGAGTSHDKIYECLRWCIKQSKTVIGGRNIYVPSDRWNEEMLTEALSQHKSLFKLRRLGDGKY